MRYIRFLYAPTTEVTSHQWVILTVCAVGFVEPASRAWSHWLQRALPICQIVAEFGRAAMTSTASIWQHWSLRAREHVHGNTRQLLPGFGWGGSHLPNDIKIAATYCRRYLFQIPLIPGNYAFPVPYSKWTALCVFHISLHFTTWQTGHDFHWWSTVV